MNTITPTPTISPRAGLLLTQLAKSSDFDAALWKLLLDYLDLKVQALELERAALEAKWGMSFGEFQRKIEDNSLGEDVYAFSVEQDYWQWEKNETLRQYYEELRARWTSTQGSPVRRVTELRGLGKEIWQDVDAQRYVDELRSDWDRGNDDAGLLNSPEGWGAGRDGRKSDCDKMRW
jgi:hypothetical protein